ncbi:hypothetical protein BDW74DRAFT_150303 [Aspergillus multicolor]|uniref:uncharacterized protein n=1 Tax=Aspergillus multicolor TaxID=41759 RepID=UPI003CCDEF20
MQCFLRVLSGSSELIQKKKISHKGYGNFETVNVRILCGKLFPSLGFSPQGFSSVRA